MGTLLIFILPFFILVFIALTYDKTVTPFIGFIKNQRTKIKKLLPVSKKNYSLN